MNRDTQLRGERRWTAVLCADLVNFTGMSKTLGPERTYELMRLVVGAARSEIEKNAGHIIEYAGDALFAVFGAPTAAENASLDACRAALAVQSRMQRDADAYARDFGLSPSFRIGLAGGSVVFGSLGHGERLDINVLGDAVNLAMRLQKETPKGTVICSDAIHNLVEGFVDVQNNGPTNIKGLAETHITHKILSLKTGVSFFEGRMKRGTKEFFGREDELDGLYNWLTATRSPMIEVSGPPGAGKSRLIHEFLTRQTEKPHILIGQCNVNTQQTALTPIIEIIRTAINHKPHDTKDALTKKLADLTDVNDPAFSYILNRVGGFEGDGSTLPNQSDNGVAIRRLCEKLLAAISGQQDALFLIEDAHWIDAISEAVINNLIEGEDTQDFCRFMVTRRSHITRQWTGRRTITEIALAPLSQASVKGLILVLLDTPNVDAGLVELVDEKSERIPLFVEEIVRYLQFSGAIDIKDNCAQLNSTTPPNIVSGNLQHLVLSRFDALPLKDRKLLVIAAARGRQFSSSFLSDCAADPTDSAACIRRAQEAGLIEDDPSRGDQNWRFSHALIGEAIYQSLLGPERRDIHATIAAVLEAGSDGPTTQIAGELATHFKSAGNHTKAVHYLWQSAQKAYEIFSVVLVDEQLETAFALIEAEPDLVDTETFGQMLFLWGRTLDVYGNFRKLNTIMERYIPRLRAQGASEVLSLCLSMKALARCHAAEFKRAQELLDEALNMAQTLNIEFPTIWAKVVQMRINVDSGFADLGATADLYAQVKPVAERLQDSHLIQLSTYVMMTAYRGEGALKRANEFVDWLTEFGTTHNSTRAIAMSHWARCINHLVRDEMDAAIMAANENLRLTVAPTADWRIAAVGRTVAKLNRGDPDVSPSDLLPFVETTMNSDDTTLGNAVRAQYWINMIGHGHLLKGWTGLVRTQRAIGMKSTPEIRRFIELVRAEVLMSVAGILPRSGPRPKLGALDMAMGLRLKIGGRKRAEQHLQNFLDLAPVQQGYFVARIMRDFGLIARSKGQEAEARDYFAKSITLYENEDMFEAALAVEAMRDQHQPG